MENLLFELADFDNRTLPEVVVGAKILSLSIPIGHSLRAAWLVLISLSNGLFIELCSVPNDLGDWREAGSLKLRLRTRMLNETEEPIEWSSYHFEDFVIHKVEKIKFQEPMLNIESGICFSNADGELWIVAATSPGSVSIKGPGLTEDFEPEFPIDEYVREQVA